MAAETFLGCQTIGEKVTFYRFMENGAKKGSRKLEDKDWGFQGIIVWQEWSKRYGKCGRRMRQGAPACPEINAEGVRRPPGFPHGWVEAGGFGQPGIQAVWKCGHDDSVLRRGGADKGGYPAGGFIRWPGRMRGEGAERRDFLFGGLVRRCRQ